MKTGKPYVCLDKSSLSEGKQQNSFAPLFMPISQKALDLENRSIGINGEPELAEAYEILKTQWKNGEREIGLHLMFLSWYGMIEPPHLTGFLEEEIFCELDDTFNEVHDYFEPQIYNDAEILYVFGLAANMFWYVFKDTEIWKQRGEDYQQRYRELAPNGIDPTIFENRGAYGEYYRGQAEIENGY